MEKEEGVQCLFQEGDNPWPDDGALPGDGPGMGDGSPNSDCTNCCFDPITELVVECEQELEDQIDMDALSDCHKKILQKLIGTTQYEFQKIFKKFNGNEPVPENYNVKFQYGSCPVGATACTNSKLENGWATITISQSVNTDATDLSFARTILHETLHAYFRFEQNYPSDCDLNCLLTKYIAKHGPNPNDIDHNLFVETKFLNDISNILKNYADSAKYNVTLLGDQFFKDMAWGGLSETDVFKEKSSIDKNRINNTVGAELYNKNYLGTAPRGIKACN